MTARPRLLDLCCSAGGATKGYQRAGFYVVGVDIEMQPNYCGDEFVHADALAVLTQPWAGWLEQFSAAHASVPCEFYMRGGLADKSKYPDLLPPMRTMLDATGLPYVLENVPGAPMRADVILCGSMFGLSVRRHRWFESNVPLSPFTLSCDHTKRIVGVYGHPHGKAGAWPGMLPGSLESWSKGLGIDWMTAAELKLAIPPAYTNWVGSQLLAALSEPLAGNP